MSSKIIDNGISLIVDTKIIRDDDVVIKNVDELRERPVKINSLWWVDNSSEKNNEDSKADSQEQSHEWFVQQFREAQSLATSEPDSVALHILEKRLKLERLSNKRKIKSKFWWARDKNSAVKSPSIPPEDLQWFYSCMQERENLSEQNIHIDLSVKTEHRECKWLTEKDRDNKKKVSEMLLQYGLNEDVTSDNACDDNRVDIVEGSPGRKEAK